MQLESPYHADKAEEELPQMKAANETSWGSPATYATSQILARSRKPPLEPVDGSNFTSGSSKASELAGTKGI